MDSFQLASVLLRLLFSKKAAPVEGKESGWHSRREPQRSFLSLDNCIDIAALQIPIPASAVSLAPTTLSAKVVAARLYSRLRLLRPEELARGSGVERVLQQAPASKRSIVQIPAAARLVVDHFVAAVP